MNSKLLHLSIIMVGLLSACFAVENITGEVVEDLFFYDGVQLAGVNYPSNPDATTGTSSVDVNGTGSITVGSRNDGGMLRLIVWGGTTVSSTRTWDATASKTWWEGEIIAPIHARTFSLEDVAFATSSKHVESKITPISTFGLGLGNETFSFSPSATLVLPVSVPDFTKLWFVVKDGDSVGNISEEDYCIVQSELCVVDVASVNEITLVRESFDDCMKVSVANGYMGTPPACQIECNKGFTFNNDLTGCVAIDDDTALDIFIMDDEFDGSTETETGTVSFLAGPARQGYLRYTGSNVQRIPLDTTNLSGEELRDVLKRNASVANRNVDSGEDESGFSLASLSQTINDLRGKIWVWENPVAIEGGEGEARSILADGGVDAMGDEITGHASAPLLPSTGPVGIFVGLAAFGIGLMAFSRRK